jgi:DNA-binding PadR family transcriptional regulator
MSRRPNISEQARLALASFLAQPQAWRHGYDITRETGLKSGTLYPLLMRLHDQGFLEAEWRPSAQAGRPPRHAYRLTASGIALAREMRPATVPLQSTRLGTAT